MQLLINDTTISFPTGPDEVTLGQRMEFYNQHGKLLDEMLKSIMEMDDADLQGLEFMEWQMERMYSVFSFFSGIDKGVLKESAFTDEIASVYFNCLQYVFDDMEVTPQQSFEWNGEVWVIDEPVIRQGSSMTFGEFIDAKQAVQDLIANGGSKMDILHPLCAIFLKKKVSDTQEQLCTMVPIGLN